MKCCFGAVRIFARLDNLQYGKWCPRNRSAAGPAWLFCSTEDVGAGSKGCPWRSPQGSQDVHQERSFQASQLGKRALAWTGAWHGSRPYMEGGMLWQQFVAQIFGLLGLTLVLLNRFITGTRREKSESTTQRLPSSTQRRSRRLGWIANASLQMSACSELRQCITSCREQVNGQHPAFFRSSLKAVWSGAKWSVGHVPSDEYMRCSSLH